MKQIECIDVTKSYGREMALFHVNCVIKAGKVYALCGGKQQRRQNDSAEDHGRSAFCRIWLTCVSTGSFQLRRPQADRLSVR